MKIFRLNSIVTAFALLSVGLAGTGYAFHDGGVGRCEGCHTMHSSFGGQPIRTQLTVGHAGPYLLQANDQSSACLNCHGIGDTSTAYHVSTQNANSTSGILPEQYTPGGDFSWLKMTTTNADMYGHNVIAIDYSYTQDTSKVISPGGNYPANKLACSSCHDPHGRWRILSTETVATTGDAIGQSGSYGAAPVVSEAVGAFRILAGNGYEPKSTPGFAFTHDPPIAVSPSTYNRTEATSETRVAYGSDMSEWCGNCHSGFVQNGFTSGMAGLTHPTGNSAKLSASNIYSNYNAYVKTGDMTGTVANSYTSLVPFETGETIAGRSNLLTLTTSTSGPDGTANITCLSCHRVHASGFPSMMRFSTDSFITEDGFYGLDGTGGPSQALWTAAYYGRPSPQAGGTEFASFQRTLCNKCHAKD